MAASTPAPGPAPAQASADAPSLFSRTLGRLGLLPWVRVGGGTLQVGAPEWVYDLCAFAFFPVNWVIAAAASRFPSAYNAPDWPLDPALAPARIAASKTSMPLDEVRALVRRRETRRLADGDLWALFDSLPAPTTNDAIGNWRGKVVRTGSWLDLPGAIEVPARFIGLEWGKRYFTPYRGDPLIFIWWGRVVHPVPMWGSVSLPEIAFRGKTGAAMTYDHQPWKDHFRVLDDGQVSGRRMLLGNWMSREKNGGWFTLEEMPHLDAAVRDRLVRAPVP